jgi:RNase P subunit RPR2
LHFEFALSVAELKPAFAKLLGFIIHFHREHLDESLSSVIHNDLWSEAIKVQDYGQELFSRAQARLSKEKIDNNLVWVCLKCGWEAFVIQDDINTCYVCATQEDVVECDSCHELEYAANTEATSSGSEAEDYELVVCRGCIDAAADWWADVELEGLIMERHSRQKD